eukprot:1155566-Pelagomonas_calceolata.AAC.7
MHTPHGAPEYHKTREELLKSGAVVHEEIYPHQTASSRDCNEHEHEHQSCTPPLNFPHWHAEEGTAAGWVLQV